MKLTTRITICDDCKMEWIKPFWEPKWLARKAAAEEHPEFHEMVMNPETNTLALAWRKYERERIIELLKARKDGECGFGVTHDLIALIKGEN